MSYKEDLQKLLKEFGATIELNDLSLDEEQRCNLFFDEIPVSIELSSDEKYVYMYSYIGDVPLADSETFGLKLLEANYLYLNTHRCSLGVHGTSRKVALIYHERMRGLELPDFESALEEFINTAEYWMKNLYIQAPVTTDKSEELSGMEAGTMKV